ncbi:MAG: helix-turn-helix domain-containing protein [Ruminococcus sp.]|nr:helix-turn-helix domain-containing protein [Ruminococcus sp.]
MQENNVVKILSKLFVFESPPIPRKGNFFPLPNEIFNIDLCAGEIALYSYLMRMEDRKTYSCYPSFKTIGNALRISRNTVMKYVHSLEEKGLITTEHTSVITQAGIKRNGNLKYQILPIKYAVDEFHQKQIDNGGIKQKN